MAREQAIGNPYIKINFDRYGTVRDIYQDGEIQTADGREAKPTLQASVLGVWVEGKGETSYVNTKGWRHRLDYVPGTAVTANVFRNDDLGIELRVNDAVHPTANVHVRRLEIRSLAPAAEPLGVKVFATHKYGFDRHQTEASTYVDDVTNSVMTYHHRHYVLSNGAQNRVNEAGEKVMTSGYDWREVGQLHVPWSPNPIRDSLDGDMPGGWRPNSAVKAIGALVSSGRC